MSNTIIQLKSSSSLGNVPNVLYPGELAINYGDGKLYYGNTSNQAILFDVITEPAGLNQEIQFNDSGSFGSSANLKFNSSTKTLTTHDLIVSNNLTSITTNNIINVSSSIFSQANLAFDKANTDVTNVNVIAGTYGNATHFPIVTVTANGRIANISITQSSSSSALDPSDYFPINNNWGLITDTALSVFGELLIPEYDCRIDPITPNGYLLTKDFGYLT